MNHKRKFTLKNCLRRCFKNCFNNNSTKHSENNSENNLENHFENNLENHFENNLENHLINATKISYSTQEDVLTNYPELVAIILENLSVIHGVLYRSVSKCWLKAFNIIQDERKIPIDITNIYYHRVPILIKIGDENLAIQEIVNKAPIKLNKIINLKNVKISYELFYTIKNNIS